VAPEASTKQAFPFGTTPFVKIQKIAPGRGALNFGSAEARSPRATSRSVTMTFGAVLFEENGTSSNCVWIVCSGFARFRAFSGAFLQFRVDGGSYVGVAPTAGLSNSGSAQEQRTPQEMKCKRQSAAATAFIGGLQRAG